MKVYTISAVTLFVDDMSKSCEFYSKIPGFVLASGSHTANFTTFEIGDDKKTSLNLESKKKTEKRDFGRIIFYTDDIDELYSYLKNDFDFVNLATFENKPTDARWGERFFHIRDPDDYQLSFAMPIIPNDKHREGELVRKKKKRYTAVYKKRYREK